MCFLLFVYIYIYISLYLCVYVCVLNVLMLAVTPCYPCFDICVFYVTNDKERYNLYYHLNNITIENNNVLNQIEVLINKKSLPASVF
jgi:hypothetical protein